MGLGRRRKQSFEFEKGTKVYNGTKNVGIYRDEDHLMKLQKSINTYRFHVCLDSRSARSSQPSNVEDAVTCMFRISNHVQCIN